jgi:hypothetical protein
MFGAIAVFSIAAGTSHAERFLGIAKPSKVA